MWLPTMNSATISGRAHRKAPRAEQSFDVLEDAEEEPGHDEVRDGVKPEKVCDQAGQGLEGEGKERSVRGVETDGDGGR